MLTEMCQLIPYQCQWLSNKQEDIYNEKKKYCWKITEVKLKVFVRYN